MPIEILNQLSNYQLNKMLNYAKKIYPNITSDDLWQPNDFPL